MHLKRSLKAVSAETEVVFDLTKTKNLSPDILEFIENFKLTSQKSSLAVQILN